MASSLTIHDFATLCVYSLKRLYELNWWGALEYVAWEAHSLDMNLEPQPQKRAELVSALSRLAVLLHESKFKYAWQRDPERVEDDCHRCLSIYTGILVQEADRSFDADDYRDYEMKLIHWVHERRGTWDTEKRTPRTELMGVQDRLIKCNLKRRHRFIHALVHAKTDQKELHRSLSVDKSHPQIINYMRALGRDKPSRQKQYMHCTAKPDDDESVRPQDYLPQCFKCSLDVSSQASNSMVKMQRLIDCASGKTCIVPSCRNSEALFFTKEDDWRGHMMREHPAYFEPLHSEGSHRHESTPADSEERLGSCPLCGWPEEGNVDLNMLLQHIAVELDFFAIGALPCTFLDWTPDALLEKGDEETKPPPDKWSLKNLRLGRPVAKPSAESDQLLAGLELNWA
ncbi:uncharacterized protein BO97DRAFT_423094 [Aspergillus homomorphus CBS 101889]|uniref:Uncharacterized protein n=1 Tax=Aspergillus homomorphus (strain CBS 101889) TaxID=1450537 RepID=A0A395I3A2_ASPHC|nr:hypothetical protein BO97DRAFT_423094 [Aspergillus homomorphus CBS 101889]RAL14179.1 hypothetical protein BO97DRAFT_423094 [Aspergillus homomorphus CBS 101889]